MKPLPQQSPAAAMADARRRADEWDRKHVGDSDAPAPVVKLRTSCGSGRKATMMLVCIETEQAYTVKDAAALAGATETALRSALRHGYACGRAKLHFRHEHGLLPQYALAKAAEVQS